MTETLVLEAVIPLADGFDELCGRSPRMRQLLQSIRRVAPTGATVLLSGETGTGKEVAARTIHALSDRSGEAFVALNCGAVSASLVESELFGHEKGSFTGASHRHNGVFARADRGTLFLDEITEMPLDLQVKLLRVLETGEFHRLGGEGTVRTGARVIAAANRDPAAAVRLGRLRQDLFYRLQVFPIQLPTLRERPGDVELLAQHFLDGLNREHGTDKTFAAAAMARLRRHSWPGNVRELKHFVQQAYILADQELDAATLPTGEVGTGGTGGSDTIDIRVGSTIAEAERQLIAATMERLLGDKQQAARVLGISLKTLYCRLNVYAAERAAS